MLKSKAIKQQHRLASGYVLRISKHGVPGSNPALTVCYFFEHVFLENNLSLKLMSPPPVAIISSGPSYHRFTGGCSNGLNLVGMRYRCETFRDCRTTIPLSSLKFPNLNSISCSFYWFPNKQNLMCELCRFLQIQSHIMYGKCIVTFPIYVQNHWTDYVICDTLVWNIQLEVRVELQI